MGIINNPRNLKLGGIMEGKGLGDIWYDDGNNMIKYPTHWG